MPAQRFFLKGPLEVGRSSTISQEEVHHLRVMRAKPGDEVELVNGQGVLAQALLETMGSKAATVRILRVEKEKRAPFRITLAQALPRQNRLTTILEKATELGVDQILLFPGELSERKDLAAVNGDRLESILIASLKQCGRLTLPLLRIMPSLKEWKSSLVGTGAAYFGDLEPEAPWLSNLLCNSPLPKEVLFFIGPESGLSCNEIRLLREVGAQCVKLHSNILRTDTAPIVALGLIHHLLMAEGQR